jgi:hypothetical protein
MCVLTLLGWKKRMGRLLGKVSFPNPLPIPHFTPSSRTEFLEIKEGAGVE